MKNVMLLLWAAVLLFAAGCGGREDAETAEPDLGDLYAGGAEAFGWTEDGMTDAEGELLDAYYPGLSALSIRQLVAKVPAMSSDVNEIVLVQCETGEDAEAAEAILQARVDAQVESGAWYAETQAAWEQAAVLRQGTFAALIASGDHQADWEARVREAYGIGS